MYCPECGSEYREGFVQCADCDVPLVDTLPQHEPFHPEGELVTVLETADPGLIALAESLLLGADIPYLKKGDQIQDLFAAGRLGVNPVTGPVEIQVLEDQAEAARAARTCRTPTRPEAALYEGAYSLIASVNSVSSRVRRG
jgi:putative signal transducing protein